MPYFPSDDEDNLVYDDILFENQVSIMHTIRLLLSINFPATESEDDSDSESEDGDNSLGNDDIMRDGNAADDDNASDNDACNNDDPIVFG
jgi:hypothetical protein